jgi:hypothetical protein
MMRLGPERVAEAGRGEILRHHYLSTLFNLSMLLSGRTRKRPNSTGFPIDPAQRGVVTKDQTSG